MDKYLNLLLRILEKYENVLKNKEVSGGVIILESISLGNLCYFCILKVSGKWDV